MQKARQKGANVKDAQCLMADTTNQPSMPRHVLLLYTCVMDFQGQHGEGYITSSYQLHKLYNLFPESYDQDLLDFLKICTFLETFLIS